MSIEEFTVEQVEKHNSDKDCFLIIDNKVYDVTKFLEDHPGGEEVITELAGQNATEAFAEIGHSQEATELMKKYFVGSLKGEVKKTAVPESKKVKSYPTDNEDSLVTKMLPVAVVLVAGFIYFKFIK